MGISIEKLMVHKKIHDWYYGENKVFFLISSPYNGASIFNPIIEKVIEKSGKVLYLWEMIQKIKKSQTKTQNLKNYNSIKEIKDKYDLIILDDISYFSSINKISETKIIKELLRNTNKLLVYCSEEYKTTEVSDKGMYIEDNRPFLEPRIIKTRVDLNNDMPELLLEYIRWFISKDKKIIVYLPDEEKLINVYEYYSRKIKQLMKNIKVIPIIKGEDKKIIETVLKQSDMATIIITNSINQSIKDSNIGSSIVLFSDNKNYSNKDLLYLCGKVGKTYNELPEIIFVCREISENMDYVKDITRGYNKYKWEKKFIEIIEIIKRSVLEIIFQSPNHCILCFKEDAEGICEVCLNKITKCKDEDELCIGYYKGVLRELILLFKIKKNFKCGEILIELLLEKIRHKYLDYILTYIPADKNTIKKRGFNQCEYIAKEISYVTGHKIINTLEKIKKTKEQKTLSKEEREINVKGAFKAINNKKILNKKFILIDDVMTTGSTLLEGKKVLIENGALEVKILTLAKSTI